MQRTVNATVSFGWLGEVAGASQKAEKLAGGIGKVIRLQGDHWMTTALNGLLNKAQAAARRRGQQMSTGHMLLAMLQDPRSGVGLLLANQGVREIELIDSLDRVEPEASNAIGLSLERAKKIASVLGDANASEVHLLLAITRESRTAGHRCLERLGKPPSTVQQHAIEVLQASGVRTTALGVSTPPNLAPITRSTHTPRPSLPPHSAPPAAAQSTPPAAAQRPVDHAALAATSAALSATAPRVNRRVRPPMHIARPPQRKTVTEARGGDGTTETGEVSEAFELRTSSNSPLALDPRRFPVLTAIGRNLSELAAARKIDPVIGRDREIEQLLDILARRRANNPVLVGPPGVGKTAVVEGLALSLANANAALPNAQRVLIEISVGSLLAGTSVRGALSERLRALRSEVAESGGRVLVFIDEIHALIGGQDGPDSIANELKTALARGELPCIGATTEAEYRRVFERDPALCRRFSRVEIAEPSPEAALEILRGVALEYEKHHGVPYEAGALEAAVDMSVRYVVERQLPDKAIGVIDQAAARTRRRGGNVVDVRAVAEVVAEMAGVPAERLMMRDAERLLSIEADLCTRVIGQDAAMTSVANALRKGAAGLRGQRPLGTFLFLGPTGVGKTETAKAIHELLFPAGEMTRLDMSEYSEAHAVARLLGAPPGYVGHEEGGQLTEAVRLRPYQLVLLDEIEKAHPAVLLALLPLLDEGRLTDARGRTVSFRNTVIVLTSNLGVASAPDKPRLGFGGDEEPTRCRQEQEREQALQRARAAMPPELWNRIDEPLWFQALGQDAVAAIAQSFVDRLAKIVQREHGIELTADRSAIEYLVRVGHDASLGARPMKRAVGRVIEGPLAKAILGGDVARAGRVTVEATEDSLNLRFS